MRAWILAAATLIPPHHGSWMAKPGPGPTQEEINALLIDRARKGLCVCRCARPRPGPSSIPQAATVPHP